MHLIFNELSLHGQFASIAQFSAAIDRVMQIRQVARRFQQDLYCHSQTVANRRAVGDEPLPATAARLGKDRQRALMQWLTRHGPFWDEARLHSEDEWLECDGDIVTDGGVAEAAWATRDGNDRGLVSIDPSEWLRSPLRVDWLDDDGPLATEYVRNYWHATDLERDLADAPATVESWGALASAARDRFSRLVIAQDAFGPLGGHPFSRAAAESVVRLLGVLDEFAGCFDKRGERTPDGQAIYQNHFTGDHAWFSDSSASEMNEFENQLTFRHPDNPGQHLVCPWHGKIRTQTLRMHFSWPVRANEPVYVVYVGPKITKR